MKKQTIKTCLSVTFCLVLIAAMALGTTGCGDNETQIAGTKSFTFEVVDKEGKTTTFQLESDKETVGDALLAENLIEGEEGNPGFYVKKVNGITADFDVDGTYWMLYENGVKTNTGVDSTKIKDGATYTFKVEK